MSEHLKSGIQNAIFITYISARLSQYIFFFFFSRNVSSLSLAIYHVHNKYLLQSLWAGIYFQNENTNDLLTQKYTNY